MATRSRVLVHLRHGADGLIVKAPFAQSLLDSFGCAGHNADLYGHLEENKLILSKTPWLDGQKVFRMQRPSFCPMHSITPQQVAELTEAVRERGVDVGCNTILESSDGKVLLTQRADHLNIFPGIWVPPGGHIEQNETILEAGLRELGEETGLKISVSQCHGNTIPILAMWESSYPSRLSKGLPRRHHTVIYIYTKLKEPYTAQHLQNELKLDPQEVKASSWIDRSLIEAVVKYSDEESSAPVTIPSNIPPVFSVTEVDMSGKHTMTERQTSLLFNKDTGEGNDVERISSGTKFGLSQWLLASKA